MAHIKFTPNLKRFFPDLAPIDIEADTMADVLVAINKRWDGLADYIVDEQGHLRKHVNIFIGDDLLVDRKNLSDSVNSDTQIYIMQALSGG